jgi:serine/threonine-protein kinase
MVLANRYRLLELLAADGIAESWRAADLPSGRDVAVRLSLAEHAGHAERFLAAARRAARVIHPGIVCVLDYGQSGPEGIPFLVTELVGTSSLATLTQAGPLDPPWVLEVVWLLAGALETAHAAGLVHQNITSANILLAPGGAVKLTDLALSDAAEPDVGTPAGDLCALGAVAWECLTGAPPLPAARPLPAVVPRGLAALVADLTAADPRTRPATAAEVATRAGELLADQKIVGHYAQPLPVRIPPALRG